MANGIWYGSVNDSATRRAIDQARITVTDPETDDLLGLFKDREGTQPIGNPFLTGKDGGIQFFVRAGRINVNVTKGAESKDFLDEIIADDWGQHVCVCGDVHLSVAGTYSASSSYFGVILDGSISGYPNTPFILTLAFSSETTEYSLHENNVNLQLIRREGRLTVFSGISNGPLLNDKLTIYLNGEAPDGTGDSFTGYIFVCNGLAKDDCLVANVDSQTGIGALNISAPDSCDIGAGVMFIFSDFGMSTLEQTGFDTYASPGAGQMGAYISSDYKNSSQGGVVGVGSGTIYGIVVALRTQSLSGLTGPTISLENISAENALISISLSPTEQQAIDYMVARYRVAGDLGWIEQAQLFGSATDYSYYNLDWSTDYEFNVYSKIADAQIPSNVVSGTTGKPLFLAAAMTISPYVMLYNVDDSWSLQDFPGTAPTGAAKDVRFSPDGSLLAVAHANSPRITIYDMNTWDKISNPATLPTGDGYGCAFSPDGSRLAVAHANSPRVTIYNTSTWAKLSNPATLPTGDGNGCAFSPDGSLLAVAHANSPRVTIYNTSTWAKLSNPATLPPDDAVEVAFSPDGRFLAVAHVTSPLITIYNTDDWSKVTNPATLPAGDVAFDVCFSPDSSLLVVGHNSSPFITIYNTDDWSKVANPATLPAATAFEVSFSPDGGFLAVGHGTALSDSVVMVYDTSDWSLVLDLDGPGTGGNAAWGVAWNNG